MLTPKATIQFVGFSKLVLKLTICCKWSRWIWKEEWYFLQACWKQTVPSFVYKVSNLSGRLALVQKFVSFHFTQGHWVKAVPPELRGKQNPKVFACSHETFATLNRCLCSLVVAEQPFTFLCRNYEMTSHRGSRWDPLLLSYFLWKLLIKATQLYSKSLLKTTTTVCITVFSVWNTIWHYNQLLVCVFQSV